MSEPIKVPVRHASLTEFYSWLDRILGMAKEKSASRGHPHTCQAHCSACCSEPLTVSKIEAQYLWDRLPDETRQAMVPKIQAWIVAMESSGLADFQSDKLDAVRYRRLNLVCPLLSADGLCSVYYERPASCRMHNAVGPRACCEDLARRPRQQFAIVPEISRYAALCMAHLSNGSIETGHLVVWFGIFLGLIKNVEVTTHQVTIRPLK